VTDPQGYPLGTTVEQNPPRYQAMQWTQQGDPNDPDAFPPGTAFSGGQAIWTVDTDGNMVSEGWGTYPPGTWFVTGPYFGDFPGWMSISCTPILGSDGLPDPNAVGNATAPYSEVSA
jgi:hypothetical protein